MTPAPSGIGRAAGSFGARGASVPPASGCSLRSPNTASAAAGCGWNRSNRSRLSGLEEASERSGQRGSSGPRGAGRCPMGGGLRIDAQRAERLVRRGGRLRSMASTDRVDARFGCVSAQTSSGDCPARRDFGPGELSHCPARRSFGSRGSGDRSARWCFGAGEMDSGGSARRSFGPGGKAAAVRVRGGFGLRGHERERDVEVETSRDQHHEGIGAGNGVRPRGGNKALKGATP